MQCWPHGGANHAETPQTALYMMTLVAMVLFGYVTFQSIQLILYLQQQTKNITVSDLQVVIFRLCLVAAHAVFSFLSYAIFILTFRWIFWIFISIRIILFHGILQSIIFHWDELLKRYSRKSPTIIAFGLKVYVTVNGIVTLFIVGCAISSFIAQDCFPPWDVCPASQWNQAGHLKAVIKVYISSFIGAVCYLLFYQILLYCWLHSTIVEKASSDGKDGQNLVRKETRSLRNFLIVTVSATIIELVWVVFTVSDNQTIIGERFTPEIQMYVLATLEHLMQFLAGVTLIHNLWKKRELLVASVNQVPQFTEEDLEAIWNKLLEVIQFESLTFK